MSAVGCIIGAISARDRGVFFKTTDNRIFWGNSPLLVCAIHTPVSWRRPEWRTTNEGDLL